MTEPAATAAPDALDRRSFLRIGGLTVATAALLAACGDDSPGGGEGAGDAPAEEPENDVSQADLTLLRTASSLEAAAIATYERIATEQLVQDEAVAEVFRLMLEHHEEHLDVLTGATSALGGEAVREPNSALMAVVEPALAARSGDADVIRVAYDLEQALAATHSAAAGSIDAAGLTKTLLGVGGAEARHVTAVAGLLDDPSKPPFPADGFLDTAVAVSPGTGV